MKRKQFDMNTSERARAIMYCEKHGSQERYRSVLGKLNAKLDSDKRDLEICDTVGFMFGHDLDEIEICDYLWLCELITKSTFYCCYMYKILPEGIAALSDGRHIEFTFKPHIFPRSTYDEFVGWDGENQEIFAALFKGGVEFGTLEYWQRYHIYEREGPDALYAMVATTPGPADLDELNAAVARGEE